MSVSAKHQSEVARLRAQQAIDTKIEILQGWLANGIPRRRDNAGNSFVSPAGHQLLEYFPRSLRQFKLWDASQNSEAMRSALPTLSRIGNDTLARRPSCADRALALMNALIEASIADADSAKASKLSVITARLRSMERHMGIRIAELHEQQREIRRLERENARLLSSQASEAEECRRVVDRLNRELKEERDRNSALTASLAKIAPLRLSKSQPDEAN